jgi:hypothetical protein
MPTNARAPLTLLLLAVGCYGTPRTAHHDGGAGAPGAGGLSGVGGAAGTGGAAGSGGTGGAAGTGGNAVAAGSSGSAGAAGSGGGAGTAGVASTGGIGAVGGTVAVAGSRGNGGSVAGGGGVSGAAGASGGRAGSGPGGESGAPAGAGGSAGSGTVFLSGPCVVRTADSSLEVLARASDGNIYRRAFDGTTWNQWARLVGLGETTDARSDLDCSATGQGNVHIVATGLTVPGALLHAFGSGTSYNRFARELSDKLFDPSPSIAITPTRQFIGGTSYGSPALHQSGDPSVASDLTPITTQTTDLLSSADIASQSTGASGLLHFAAFDVTGALAIYPWVNDSSGYSWRAAVTIPPPTGTFAFSPAICTESGGWGIYSVNVAAVTGAKLWFAQSDSITTPFSTWRQVADNVASSPDCAIGGPDSIAHIVILNAAGAVIDVHGKGTNWVTTDLGYPR